MYHHLMAFRWDTNVGEFLFPGINVNGLVPVILLCIILIFLSVFYEGIKVIQTQSKARTARERLQIIAGTSNTPSDTSNLLITNKRNNDLSTSKQAFRFISQLSSFLFHNILGYILMLSVMVYNIYVFIAVIFGMGLGYFLFGHMAMKINMENLRAKTTNAMFSARSSASTSRLDNITPSNNSPNSSLSSSSFINNVSPNYNSTVQNNQAKVDINLHNETEESYSCRL